MEQDQLQQLENKNITQISTILAEFNKKNADLLAFESFHTNNQWHDLWRAVFGILDDANLVELHTLALNTVRILTRDEFSLETNYIEVEVKTLLQLAQIDGIAATKLSVASTPTPDELQQQHATPFSDDIETGMRHQYRSDSMYNDTASAVISEALKCLCNLVYQSADCRRQCMRHHAIDAIVKRVTSAARRPCALEHYDMKLLFLLTALETSARNRLQLDLNGITYMTKWLDDKLSEETETALHSEEQINIICELLKVMFNITSCPDKSPNEYEIQSLHLTCVIRELLLRYGNLTNELERRVVSQAINLLTNISGSCLIELTQKCNSSEQQQSSTATATATITSSSVNSKCNSRHTFCFEKRNVSTLEILLRFLRQSLEQQDAAAAITSHELISPVLTVLLKCARADRVMRHYLRREILPPLRDVTQRPEVGNELRNYLCRFLTLPAMLLRDLSAELLFVLCKENVGRMIKYTGYGNAAGLFANRGLLDCRRIDHNEYSSDSEDSDTEEYKRKQDGINPVLGCYEKPKQNPLEGMSEAQKEYEAMQLVGLIDKLHKSGIVQPCRIGDDGKPQPLEHILQLQEELPQQQLEQKHKT